MLALAEMLHIPLPELHAVSKRRNSLVRGIPQKTGVIQNKKKLTIDHANEVAAAKGGKCLSSEYLHIYERLTWQCAADHTWQASLKSVKDLKSWCPVCAGKQRLTIEEMQGIATERGGQCLSGEYINAVTKLTWQCAQGHTWEATPDIVKQQKSWCPICAGKQPLGIAQMQQLAESKGGQCLSEVYVNTVTKLKWQCAEGHVWEASPHVVKYCNSWCPACRNKWTQAWDKRLLKQELKTEEN